MHEVSIAASIVKIAEEELKKNSGRSIDALHLEIGSLSGVVIESLRFALEVSKKDGVLEKANIQIDEIPAKVKCRSCSFEFKADDYFVVCPECQGIHLDFLSGRSLQIKSIVIS